MRPAQAYPDACARIYDIICPDFARGLAPRIFALHERRRRPSAAHGAMLDLCCGSGLIARHFAERGVPSFGVDASPAMIEVAERAAARLPLPPHFIVDDARTFSLPTKVSLCAATYAAMNHLESIDDFANATSRVLTHLDAGGLFVFDLMTRLLLERFDGEMVRDQADLFEFWRYTADKERGRSINSLNGFVRDPETGHYRRYSNLYILYMYRLAEVRDLMLSQGWSDVVFTAYTDLETPLPAPEQTMSVMVVATSRQEM